MKPTIILVKPQYQYPLVKRVGIYCRVSSKLEEQLSSLTQQVSHFTRMVMNNPYWRLTDIYIDFHTADTTYDRAELNRLLQDCRNGTLDMVITKSISRFGRDTVDMLNIIRELRDIGVGVFFEQEKLSTEHPENDLLITILESFAQTDNESRSENVKISMKMRASDGSSGLYKRRCYGYYSDENGDLQINEDEAKIVRQIFEMYLSGESLVGIIRKLDSDGVKTATGKKKWSKNTLDKMLSNEKYCGNVEIFKTYSSVTFLPIKMKTRKINDSVNDRYMLISGHPAIISKEAFDAVQIEKARRCNVEITAEGTKRKTTRYSKKRDGAVVSDIAQ